MKEHVRQQTTERQVGTGQQIVPSKVARVENEESLFLVLDPLQQSVDSVDCLGFSDERAKRRVSIHGSNSSAMRRGLNAPMLAGNTYKSNPDVTQPSIVSGSPTWKRIFSGRALELIR